jgi:DNA-binding IclR family transcriptional regulator
MPGNKDIRAVGRALDMLTLLGNSPQGMASWEIVQAVGVSRITVHRMLRAMVQRGFVEKAGSPGRYALSPYLNGLRTHQAAWNRGFLTPAVRHVVELARRTNAHVFAGQYVGGRVMARFRSNAGDPDETRMVYGWPLLPYSSGLVYQACMDPRELANYRSRHNLIASDVEYWKSFHLLDELLVMVKEEGWLAFVKDGILRAGAAVFDRDGHVCGILALVREAWRPGGPDPAECVRALPSAARELSAEIAASQADRRAPSSYSALPHSTAIG